MTSAAHIHAVTAMVDRMKKMYPGCRVTTEIRPVDPAFPERDQGTIIKVWGDIGCVDARWVRVPPATKGVE